jgi:hypothetical protein
VLDGPDIPLLLSLFVLQVPGAIFTLRRRRRIRWYFRTALVIVPAVAFWLFADARFERAAAILTARGQYACGMFGLMVATVLIGGFALNVVLGSLVQGIHAFLTRRQERRLLLAQQATAAV